MGGISDLMPKFDPTITIGVLIHGALLIVTLIGIYWRMRETVFRLYNDSRSEMMKLHADTKEDIAQMTTKIDAIWEWWLNRQERRN